MSRQPLSLLLAAGPAKKSLHHTVSSGGGSPGTLRFCPCVSRPLERCGLLLRLPRTTTYPNRFRPSGMRDTLHAPLSEAYRGSPTLSSARIHPDRWHAPFSLCPPPRLPP
jgi:hypothetical protein